MRFVVSGGIGPDPRLADVRERAEQLPATDGTRPGRLLEDGAEGAAVECTVSGGAPHLVEASISGNQTSPTSPGVGTIGMYLTNGWIDSGGAGEATIMLQTTTYLYRTASETVCTLSLESASADNQFSVGTGRIYARFDCPNLEDPPTSGCTASGAFALAGCDHGG